MPDTGKIMLFAFDRLGRLHPFVGGEMFSSEALEDSAAHPNRFLMPGTTAARCCDCKCFMQGGLASYIWLLP